MRIKKVAIIGWGIGPNSVGITNTYFNLIQHLGGEVIIINTSMSDQTITEIANDVDLLILPGGADLSAHLYKRKPHIFNSNPDVHKEHFFVNHLHKFVEAGTAIFGICLGFQMLNVYFGGTLTQDVYALHTSDRRGVAAHKVIDVNTGQKFEVNSHHHQAVKRVDLSEEMTVLTVSDEYDKDLVIDKKRSDRSTIIESFIHKELPIAGVQWHPEEWFDSYSISLINQIYETSRERKV